MAPKKSSTVNGVSVSKNSNGTWSVGGTTYSSSTAAANALKSSMNSSSSSSSSSSSGGGGGSSSYKFVDPSVLQDANNGMSAQDMADKRGISSADTVNEMLTNNENTYGTYYNGQSDLYKSGGVGSSAGLNTATLGVTPIKTSSVSIPDINRYGYNSSTGYYQKLVKSANDTNYNGLNGSKDDQHYGILYDKDKFAPEETFTLDSTKVDTENADLLTNDYNRANADLSGVSPDFLNNVNSKLQSAFGISNLNELKSRYPEQYSSLVDSLKAVSGVRDATDPNSRNLLEGQLQAIIGTAVGAGSDMSKLKVLESSIMDKFKNPEQIKADAQNVVRLQTQGKSTGEIASEMGISEDQVQQLVLLANGLDSKAGEYYQLKDEAAKDITEDYDTKLERLEEEKQIALERANRNLEWLKEDFNTSIERQKKTNEINAHNADFMAGQYGFGFSKRGIEGLDYVNEQARQIIEDITQNYDRNSAEMADGIADIIRNWEYNNEDLLKASEDALTQAKNAYTSNMLAIQQQYGTVGLQAQNALAQNVQNFITQAETIYDNALNRQQQNLTNLITNVGNMNALATQNLTLRQARIQQFQNESMNLNRSQLQNLANQLGMSSQEYLDLVNYQAQAVANELNGYVPGAGVQMQGQIQSYLNQGYTPMETLSNIMNSSEFRQMVATGGDGTNGVSTTGTSIGNAVSSETIGGITYAVSQETYNKLSDFYSSNPIGSIGGQCGAFVNDYLESLGVGRLFTDPIKDKQKVINTPEGYQPQIGDVVVMDSPSQPQYGHVAIVTGIDENGVITTLESNRKNNDGVVFSRQIDPANTKIYGYYHPDGGSNTIGGMSNYDKNTAIANITKMAFGGNASDDDKDLVKEIINDGDNMGKNETEIAYNIVGWKNIDPKYKDFAGNLANLMQTSNDGMNGFDCRGIVNLINQGNLEEAMLKVENTIIDGRDKSDLGIGTMSDAMYVLNSIQAIKDNINSYENKDGAFGFYDNLISGLHTSLYGAGGEGSSRRLYNETKAALSNLFNEYRNSVFGSALTESEIKESKKQLPTMSDKLSVVNIKFDAFENNILSQVNARRKKMGLPDVTKEQLVDPEKRLDLYNTNNQLNTVQGRGGLSKSGGSM